MNEKNSQPDSELEEIDYMAEEAPEIFSFEQEKRIQEIFKEMISEKKPQQ
ncbi:hypothetical protein [Pseudomonas fluorescens]|uniref:Uncharacterized protein n=1 Tax=Pseudomonas fluorescens TaxID=294 RepID=A0A5E7BMM9_PSEFL|nr:hypothetical protein [Pseudomonas fluorescens]VVN93316.1 hypothetical protein PS691_02041 [Pseudomonas fluorescens]